MILASELLGAGRCELIFPKTAWPS